MPNRPSPAPLLELATGYQRSKVLFALIELGVPTLLAAGPLSLAEIAPRIGVEPLAADRFLNACVALGLLNRDGDEFRNAGDAERFLVREAPTYLGDLFLRYERVSSSEEWTRFAERLKAWRPGISPKETPPEDDQARAELHGQHQHALLAGEALGQTTDLSPNRALLDLGGGTGAMSIALCRRFPGLHALVFERPAIAAIARDYVRASEIADRIQVRDGDFVKDPLPAGFDVVLLSNVLSAVSVENSRALLRRVYQLLPEGGIVLLSGWMLDGNRTGPLLPVLFCLEDIDWGAPDVERSAATYAAWLTEFGFKVSERVMYLDPMSLLVGRKPKASAR